MVLFVQYCVCRKREEVIVLRQRDIKKDKTE